MNSAQPDVSDTPEQTNDPGGAAVDPAPPEHAFTISDIFLGPDGLRAIWGIALFLLLREALRYTVYPLVQMLFPSVSSDGGPIGPRTLFVFEGAGLFCVIGATWLMAKIERRPASAYGFGPQHRLRNFGAGLAWGVALLSLLIVTLRATGLLVFDARVLFGRSILGYGFVWLAGFLFVALAEEVYLRGYLQFTLSCGLSGIYRSLFGASYANALGFWTAALILSFAFGFGHRTNPGESPLGLLSAGLAGFLFCLSLWRTGSLWWAIGFHVSWDWAQSFLYGVADSGLMVKGHLFATHPVGRPYLSGGLTGPEGSLFLLPVMLAGVAVILFTLPRTNLGYQPASAPEPSLH
jgi:membrane protease YdiL (CAAX protease family)